MPNPSPSPSPSPSPTPPTYKGPGLPDSYDTAPDEAYSLGFSEGIAAGMKRARVEDARKRARDAAGGMQPPG